MQIVPIKDLKNTVDIERRCAESQEPVFITKNGYGRLVVMDIEVYERTIRKMYEAKLLNEAIDQLNSGEELLDGEDVRKRTMARYGK